MDALLLLLGMLCEFPQDILCDRLAVIIGLDSRFDLVKAALHDGCFELLDAFHRYDHRLVHVPAKIFNELLPQRIVLVFPDFVLNVVVEMPSNFLNILIFFFLNLCQGLHHEL